MADYGPETVLPTQQLFPGPNGQLAPVQLNPTSNGPTPGSPEYNNLVGKMPASQVEGMPGINAATLMSQITSSATDLQRSTQAGWGAASSATQGASLVEQGKNTVNASDMITLLQRRANDARVYEMFGTDPESPTRIAILAKESADLEDDFRSRQKMIQEKLDQSFWDNPVQWLVNQITLPFDIEAANNVAHNSDRDMEVIHRLALATSEGVQLDAAAAYNTSTSKLAGLAQENAGNALIQSADATFKAVSAGISGASVSGNSDIEKARLRLSTMQFETATDIDLQRFGLSKDQFITNLAVERARLELDQKRFNLTQSNEQFTENLQTAAALRSAEQHAVTMELGKLQTGTEQEKAYARADLTNRLSQAGVLLGVKAPTIEELLMMEGGKVKSTWQSLMQQPDIQRGVYGLTPTSAMSLVTTLRAQMSPGNSVLFNQLTDIEARTVKALSLTAKQYTPEQIADMKDDAIRQAAKHSLEGIKDTGDIYSPTTLRKILTMPEMQNNPLLPGLSVLANSRTDVDGSYPTRAVDIIAAMNALLLEPGSQWTPAGASVVVQRTFQAIANNTDELKQFNRLALPSFKDIGAYNITVDKANGFFGKQTLNALNKVELETYFTRLMAGIQMQQTMPAGQQ